MKSFIGTIRSHAWIWLAVWGAILAQGVHAQQPAVPGKSTTLSAPPTRVTPVVPPPQPLYEYRTDHDPDGIGKFFMGREISFVVSGHETVGWLERSSREAEERTSLLVKLLDLKPGQNVADVGAGTGYLSRRMAQMVAPKGKVFANDIQAEMLTLLTNRAIKLGITNIVPVLGTEKDTRLPEASVDLIIMVDVYHELEYPYEMMQGMCRALKPGGRLVFVEFRLEDPLVPIKLTHKMSEAQVKKEASLHPLDWIETKHDLPRQHMIFFKRR